MKVIAIAAAAHNGVIGQENALPWHIPEDLQFFRESTRDQIVIMGRRTYESLGKALPKRLNVVISRNTQFKTSDAEVFASVELAIKTLRNRPELQTKNAFIIGGSEIYELSRSTLDELWLTEIENTVAGDRYFPNYRNGKLEWPEFVPSELKIQTDFNSPFRYRFTRFVRSV